MTRDVQIRLAGPADVPAVRRLMVETFHDTFDNLLGVARVTEITDTWHSLQNLQRQLALPAGSFLVAEDDGAIVGHALALAGHAPVLMIQRLYVLPAQQRRGVGKRLLDAAIARHTECDVARLEAAADNTKALAFYRREGFQASGESVSEGLRHLIMEKRTGR